MESLGVCDRVGFGPGAAADFTPSVEGEDEWGCIWGQTDVKNMGQVIGHPIKDLKGVHNMKCPDYTDDSRYVDWEEGLRKAEADGKYTSAGIFFVLFERMHGLHGFEDTLADLYLNRPAMEIMADKITDAHVTLVKEVGRRFPGRIDAWSMTDDWGTQQAAFVSYEFWREFFFPRYKRIFDAMHEAGCDVWVHSCGKINEIIEGYIDAGVNVVNLQQPRALGIEEIGDRYRGRIAFESLADIQATLPTGDESMIEADAEALITHWANEDGGFIFSDYGDDVAIGVPDEHIKPFMYEAFSRMSEKVYGEPLPPLP